MFITAVCVLFLAQEQMSLWYSLEKVQGLIGLFCRSNASRHGRTLSVDAV